MVGLLPEHAFVLSADDLIRAKQRVEAGAGADPDPKIIVADEAFSMLDVSMRSQIVNLLLKLQERLGLIIFTWSLPTIWGWCAISVIKY